MGNGDASHVVEDTQFWRGNAYDARLYEVQLCVGNTSFVDVAMLGKADVVFAICTSVIVKNFMSVIKLKTSTTMLSS